MAFVDVKNFKDALIQELKALQWDGYEGMPEPSKDEELDWSYYIRYRYLDSIVNSKLLGPVLIPNDTCKEWYYTMFKALGGDASDFNEQDIKKLWNSRIELVNWSGTEKLLGEVANGGVISVKNLFKYKLNENWQRASEYNIGLYNYDDWGVGKHSTDSSLNVNQKFKILTSGYWQGIYERDIPRASYVETVEKEFGTYTDSNGKKHVSEIIAFRQVPDTETGYYWTATTEENKDYIYRGENPPRTPVTNRNYTMYIKFKCTDKGATFYRYIPVFPFLNDESTSTLGQFAGNRKDMGAGSNVYLPFAYQPFNMYESNLKAFSNIYSLPPVFWNGRKQIRYFSSLVDYYNINSMFIPKDDILQYMYLTGIRFITDDSQDGQLTPFYDLSQGSGSYSTDTGIEDDEESGTTSQPGGTVGGGDKIDEAYTQPTVGKVYPIGYNLLEPGFYGGLYIPTFRYVRSVNKNDSTLQGAIEDFSEALANVESAGKGASIVECFFHYSGFTNEGKLQLEPIELNVERPTYLCAYDKNSSDAYIPINNKLFNYPYCSMELNGYGQINELKFENWAGTTPKFRIVSKFQPGATIFIYPVDYNGVKNCYDGGVAGQPLAILSYTKNDFLNEYNASQNSRSQAIQNINDVHAVTQGQTILNGITQALGGMGSAMQLGTATPKLSGMGGIGIGLSGGAGLGGGLAMTGYGYYANTVQRNAQLASFSAQLKDVENRPLAVANQNAAPSLPELITNTPAPFIVWKSIRKQFAEKIDVYFSKFGYKVSKFKDIEIKTRPRYNFIKCADCHVGGDIPQDDLLTIKSIMESGITFWHDKRVGEYGDYKDNLAPVRNKPQYLKPSYMEV